MKWAWLVMTAWWGVDFLLNFGEEAAFSRLALFLSCASEFRACLRREMEP